MHDATAFARDNLDIRQSRAPMLYSACGVLRRAFSSVFVLDLALFVLSLMFNYSLIFLIHPTASQPPHHYANMFDEIGRAHV